MPKTVGQRNLTGGMRSARSVIAQTLGRFALGHRDPADFEDYVRQRVEANYFAGALLAPEQAAEAERRGYSDWLRQRRSAVAEGSEAAVSVRAAAMAASAATKTSPAPKARRLSYNEQRELAQLPARIQDLEAEQVQLTALICDPKLFQHKQDQGSHALQRLQVLAEELDSAYARWEVLDKASSANGANR